MKGSVMFPEGRVFHLTCHYREMTGICVSNANRLWGHLRYFCSYILLEKNNICSKKENIGTFFKYFHQLCNLENIFKAIFNTIFETRKKNCKLFPGLTSKVCHNYSSLSWMCAFQTNPVFVIEIAV